MHQGIIPPLITPLRTRDQLDVEGLERLIEHVLAGGVHGLFLLGTTGEGPSLSYRLRKELIERTCRQVNQRVPVWVAISDAAFEESLRVAQWSAEAGADSVVLAPPFYLHCAQSELQGYLDRLLAELPLPLFLYNMPALTKVPLEIETVRRALDHPKVLGIKDSSGQIGYLKSVLAILRQRPDWTVLVGPEDLLLDCLNAGGHGGVNGGANLFPTLYVRLFEAVKSGNQTRALDLHRRILRLNETLYKVSDNPSRIILGIKTALEIEGICLSHPAEPFQPFSEPERTRVCGILDELRPLIAVP